MSIEQLESITKNHTFNEGALLFWLQKNLDGFGNQMEILQFLGGQSNPTFVIKDQKKEWVLRKQPPGKLLPSAHAVDREYKVQKLLYNKGVPLPKMKILCEDLDIIGTKFYVMERLIGDVYEDTCLPEIQYKKRFSIYEDMVLILARLHKINPFEIGLSDFGKPGNYLNRQISRWGRQWELSKQREIPEMDYLIKWLLENIPDDDQTTVVHGDYRLGNLMYSKNSTNICAVLDWELSTLGNPLADLGYMLLPHFTKSNIRNRLTDLNLENLGIPSAENLVKIYCKEVGREFFDPIYYVVFSMFRSAAILEGVYARGISGNASSPNAEEVGSTSKPLAEQAFILTEKY